MASRLQQAGSVTIGVTRLVAVALMWLGAFPMGSVPPRAEDQSQHPNIVAIVVDDIGVGDVGFAGGRDIPTPHLDQFAREGVAFEQAYVLPMCAPTRAALMTGRYPQRFGIEDNRLLDGRATGMDLQEVTLAQALHARGYTTHLIGKWHLGQGIDSQFAPYRRGFDHFLGFYGAAGQYFDPVLHRNGEPESLVGYNTDLLTDAACALFESHCKQPAGARPFFLHLAYLAAHLPLQAKPEDLKPWMHLEPPRRQAAAIITNLDQNIGRLMHALKTQGLDDHTLVFLLSDNGGEPPVLGTSNGPYRGQKFDLYEGGIRVPFAARWPGHIPAATRFRPMVHVTDIFPTALAAAGNTAGPELDLDGVDLLPYLQGTKPGAPHDRLYWLTTEHADWRRPDHDTNDARRYAAVREGDWKLLDLGKSQPELYHLPSDPAEAHDLAAAEPERVSRLLAELHQWRSHMKRQVVPTDHPIYGKAALQRKGS